MTQGISINNLNTTITKTVRRTIQKGTNMVNEPLITSAWTGQKFKDQEEKRYRLAGNLLITSAKGTNRINLSSMRKTHIPNTKGFRISYARGTSRLKI